MIQGLRRHFSVDLDALVSNARVLSGPGESVVSYADLRADAYGHGLVPVAVALRSAGVASFLVSSGAAADSLTAAGIESGVIRDSIPLGADLSPALGLYGLGPDEALRPTFRLSAGIVSVKTVPEGSGVSYGYTYRTPWRTRLALVSLGFADGIPRYASNRAPVLVHGFLGQITGRVAMDQFVVDIGDEQTEVSVGDEAVLIGDPRKGEPSLSDWADSVGLEPDVLLARLGPRIERFYVSSGDAR